MNDYLKNLKETVLGSWNLDSFIILLEDGDHNYDKYDWKDVLTNYLLPKFDTFKYLKDFEIELIAQEINEVWEIEEYIQNKKYLDFLDNVVDIEDFKPKKRS